MEQTQALTNTLDNSRRQFEESVAAFHSHISKDHHKDRDCHIYVFQSVDIYSYGKRRKNNLQYRLLLNGYVIEIDETFDKLENLYEYGTKKLLKYIKDDIIRENW